MDKVNEIIKHLDLIKHCEGGYFFQTYRSNETAKNKEGLERSRLTSIYYLLTKDNALSYFALNKSDLILYHHSGDPLKIIFLSENGHPIEKILGTDLANGQQPQIICPSGVWKAYDLMEGEYTLIGEAVAPGFEYEDMQILSHKDANKLFPDMTLKLKKYIANLE